MNCVVKSGGRNDDRLLNSSNQGHVAILRSGTCCGGVGFSLRLDIVDVVVVGVFFGPFCWSSVRP